MPDKQAISPEQVRHVAKLARLALDEPQLDRFAGQLESILDEGGGKRKRVEVDPHAAATGLRHPLRIKEQAV